LKNNIKKIAGESLKSRNYCTCKTPSFFQLKSSFQKLVPNQLHCSCIPHSDTYFCFCHSLVPVLLIQAVPFLAGEIDEQSSAAQSPPKHVKLDNCND
jgi:hypothetical protein